MTPFLPVLPFQPLQITHPLSTPHRRAGPLVYHPSMGHQVEAGSTSSPTEVQPDSPGRGRGSNGRRQNQRQLVVTLTSLAGSILLPTLLQDTMITA